MKIVKEAKAASKNDIQLSTLWVFAMAPVIQLVDLGQNLNSNFDTYNTNILLAVLLSISSLVCLWGCYDSDIKPGFILELGGWSGVVIVFCTYLAGAVTYNHTWYSAVSTYFFSGFVVGGILRCRKIILALCRLSWLTKHASEAEDE